VLTRALGWCSSGLALGGLALEIVNLFEFPLLRPQSGEPGSIVACVAMRNEAHNVAACLESLLQQPEIAAVVVCDDASDDDTFAILSAIAAREPRVVPLGSATRDGSDSGEAGRAGKATVLAFAARQCSAIPARMLLFTDADVRLNAGAAGALLAHADALGVQAVSAWPRTVTHSIWDALFAPLVPLFLLQALPLRAARLHPDARFSAGNGQLFLVERRAYERSGGHMPGAIVEDVTLARALKRSGARIALASAAAVASVDGYGSFAANVSGYGRSLYYGTGRRGALAFGMWQALAYVAPWLLLGFARRPALLAAAAGVTAYGLIARRMRGPRFGFFLPPLTGMAGITMVASVAFIGPRRRLCWRGRSLR